MMILFFALASLSVVSTMDLEEIGKELERNYDLDYLKNFFRFHLYVNPKPICALEDESCLMDNNCCNGLECKMAVDRKGLKYSCSAKIEDSSANNTDVDNDEPDEEDVRWTLGTGMSDELANSLPHQIYQSHLEKALKEEDALVNDQNYLIKELEKPLNFDEMRNSLLEKELEDKKRKEELKKLREWSKMRDLEEKNREKKRKEMENIAKDRVAKVLQEEQKQKLELLKKMRHTLEQNI